MKQKYIPFVEIPVVEHCNLNCNLCNSHAYLLHESYYDLSQYKKDIDILSKYVHFGVVTFLGGEPLMNKDLLQYVKYAKEKRIGEVYRILTNGILIDQIDKEILNEIDVLEVSKYPQIKQSVREMSDKLELLSHEYLFRYYVKEINYFNEIDTISLSDEEAQKGYENCNRIKRGCCIYNGYLYKCMRPKTTNLFLEKKHGIFLQDDLRQIDGLPILDDDFVQKLEIYQKDKSMLESCKYCLMGKECKQDFMSRIIDFGYNRPVLVRLYYKKNLFYHCYKMIKRLFTYDEGAHSKDRNGKVKTYLHSVGGRDYM